MASEAELIAAISAVFGSQKHERLYLGIGDDAAIVDLPQRRGGAQALLAADMALEDVHFVRKWSSLFEIGAKVTAANLADIVATGGHPDFILVSAGIPQTLSSEDAAELARGIVDEASKLGAVVVGGDIARSEKLVISLAVMGDVKDPILRSGAKPGDLVIISDFPGKSARGLENLKAGIFDSPEAIHHRRPIVNYQAAKSFALAGVSAMCDVSDGLVSELTHIAKASGVGIDLTDVEGIDLHGGEDHIFVATIDPHLPFPREAIEIGKVVMGKGVRLNGKSVVHQGFKHFEELSE